MILIGDAVGEGELVVMEAEGGQVKFMASMVGGYVWILKDEWARCDNVVA